MTDLRSRAPRASMAPAGLAAVGFVLGVALWAKLAALFTAAGPGPTEEVLRARQMGLVSSTLLEGYDKAQEVRAWVLGCVLVPLVSRVGWSLGRRIRGPAPAASGFEQPASDTNTNPKWPWLPWAATTAVALAVAIRPQVLQGPNLWGAFGLLAEEGVYLGTLQAMGSGRALYSEVHFPYGPLLIQPLRLWMSLFGDTVVVARAYVLFLHAVGVVALAALVRALLGRGSAWVACATAGALALVGPTALPHLNSALLRPVLPFLAGALVLGGLRAQNHRMMAAAGASIAAAGLISPELAAPAALGAIAALLVAGGDRRSTALVVGSALILGLVGLWGLAPRGALSFLREWGHTVSLSAMGYQALPYPDPIGIFSGVRGELGIHKPADPATFLWAVLPPLFIWAGLAAGLCRDPGRRRDHAASGLLVASLCAALLFRASLGRSDLYHLWFYGAVPVVLVSSLLVAAAWAKLPRLAASLTTVLAFGTLAVILMSASLVHIRPPGGDATVATPITHERAGALSLQPALAQHVRAVLRWCESLSDDDLVYFYPSEAALYFLCDKDPPLRYLWSYDAPTPEAQELAIADLEATQPRWLVRSRVTFPIDWIPQSRLVPTLDGYVRRHYRKHRDLEGAVVLERIRP